VLGLKGVVAVASLMILVAALVTYQATVTVNISGQFTQGRTEQTWAIKLNDQNKVRYLPGDGASGNVTPTRNTSNSSTWAFKVDTDANKVCAVKIELTAAVDDTKFSRFEITLMRWVTSAWQNETLYAGATGSTTKTYIDGLTAGASGYIHQATSSVQYYLIRVTYSYDLVETTTSITVTFRYTPLPQDSF